jgi:hypothetical protein
MPPVCHEIVLIGAEVFSMIMLFPKGLEATPTTDVTKVIIAEREAGTANHRNKSLCVPIRSNRTWESFSVSV